MSDRWTPRVTVAAVVERDGRFLVIEERVKGRKVINQPAGHLEPGESLHDAVIREALEETRYAFTPEALVGVYRWVSPGDGRTFIRFAFTGSVRGPVDQAPLDGGIHRALWMSREELAQADLRSPLVLACADDHVRGLRIPLEAVRDVDPHLADDPGADEDMLP